VLKAFFTEIAKDSAFYAFGHQQVMSALEQGAVETLMVWEKLPDMRFVVNGAGSQSVRYGIDAKLVDDEDVSAAEPLLDWLVENHSQFGCKAFEILGDQTPEGQQFCLGFGGLAAILRFPMVQLVELQEVSDSEDDDDSFWN